MPNALSADSYGLGGSWSIGQQAITAGKGAAIGLAFHASYVYLDVGGTGTLTVTAGGKTKDIKVSGAPDIYTVASQQPAGNGTVICQVESRDGHITTVGSFQVTDGRGYWGSPVPATQGPLTGARLVGPDGSVLATASLHTA